ncbi:DUF928 domain-containing protein [Nostoc sp. TCL26-01]|uniref:DUF928 domain-containing protein n=1 Tax=Nostoc sp. TCL26-01 TaxID=2576904 RepID=UPI0015C0C6B3|nr:DUF928 domain-containing protein [Nostoc sp. TCL26-01]QLE58455.1 DUF928 domain-containing protein [Nostoc sp. TCL26-01]
MKLLLALTICYTCFFASQTWVLAKSNSVNSVQPHNTNRPGTVNPTQKVSNEPPPTPSGESPPGGRVRGGAKRGTCPSVKTELTALVPFTQNTPTVTNVFGMTTQAHPTFLFYVPYAKNTTYPAEFVLQDQESNSVYEKAIALPEQPGIISISLPTTIPPLALNKQYRWFFSVYCDQQKQSPPIYVEGVIKRVNLNQATIQQLQTASPLQQSAIYMKNGIWFEALNILAQLRRKNPLDTAAQEQWQNLLTSIKLEDIAAEQLLDKPQ